MKFAVALAALMVLGLTACAMVPTPLPEPSPIGQYWAERNPDKVVPAVVDAIMEAPEFAQVPAQVRVSASDLLTAKVEDEWGNALSVNITGSLMSSSLVDVRLTVNFVVRGTIALDLGPFQSIDISVPVVVSVVRDESGEQPIEVTADLAKATVSLR